MIIHLEFLEINRLVIAFRLVSGYQSGQRRMVDDALILQKVQNFVLVDIGTVVQVKNLENKLMESFFL